MINLNYIQNYIKTNYGIIFKNKYDCPTNYEKYEELVYEKNKIKYSISVGWAYSNKNNRNLCWSIYYDFMDYKELYEHGSAFMDNGNKTIDEIMNRFGFIKQTQSTIFDFIGVD